MPIKLLFAFQNVVQAGHAQMKTIMVTGGAGFIGSHVVLELLNAGYEVIALDIGSSSKQFGPFLFLGLATHLDSLVFR